MTESHLTDFTIEEVNPGHTIPQLEEGNPWKRRPPLYRAVATFSWEGDMPAEIVELTRRARGMTSK